MARPKYSMIVMGKLAEIRRVSIAAKKLKRKNKLKSEYASAKPFKRIVVKGANLRIQRVFKERGEQRVARKVLVILKKNSRIAVEDLTLAVNRSFKDSSLRIRGIPLSANSVRRIFSVMVEKKMIEVTKTNK